MLRSTLLAATSRRLATTLIALFTLLPRSSVAGDEIFVGSTRPARLIVPTGYRPEIPAPLVVFLHGRFGTAAGNDEYFALSEAAEQRDMLLVLPQGEIVLGGTAWDALGHYCPEADFEIGDSSYIRGLIDEIVADVDLNVDLDRVLVLGYSLGGRMAYRMACEHSSVVTAVASVAGTLGSPDNCATESPVHALHVHGTADAAIFYNGGTFSNFPCSYLGAEATAARWAELNDCATSSEPFDVTFDLDTNRFGAEASTRRYPSCNAGGSSELWTLAGSGHSPNWSSRGQTTEISARILDWLSAHPRRIAPLASFEITSRDGHSPLEIHVDASASTPPEGTEIARYEWDFDDGERAVGVLATNTFDTPGVYLVSLRVVTTDGRISEPSVETVRVGCPTEDVSPWTAASVGTPRLPGGVNRTEPTSFDLCATGRGIGSVNDELFFLHQEAVGNVALGLRVPELPASAFSVTVQFRESLDPGARFAATAIDFPLGLGARRRLRTQHRSEVGSPSAGETGPEVSNAASIRIRRQGDLFVSEASEDGSTWDSLGEIELSGAPASMQVGFSLATLRDGETRLELSVTEVGIEEAPVGPHLVRGDCNEDGTVDVSDAIATLGSLFLGDAEPRCDDACDANDDGALDVSDVVSTLGALFLGQGEIPAPSMDCGLDPTKDTLGCDAFDACG